MGRPSDYSAEEDRIVLLGLGWKETNERLTEAGFETRSQSSIKQRRHYLRQAGTPVPDLTTSTAQQALTAELRRRERLSQDMDRLGQELVRVRQQIAESNSTIHGLMAQVAEEIDRGVA